MTRDPVTAIVEALEAGPESSQDAWRQVDEVVARGDSGELVRLAQGLREARAPAWLVDSIGRRFVRRLALTPGRLAQLVEVNAVGLTDWSFELEDIVAQRRDLAEFQAALVLRHRDLEFFAGLMQSLVCAGLDLTGLPEALVFRDELIEREHVLGALPLRRLELEAGLELGRYSVDSWSSSGFGVPPAAQLELVTPIIEATMPAPEPLDEAVRFWTSIETGRYQLARSTSPIALRGLPLGCLDDRHLAQARLSPAEVFARLFAAAAEGGAYGHGEGHARARVSAFRSMNAFCRDEGLEVDALAREVDRCEWWFFFGSAFFAKVAWDLGVACLRADGRTLVVLAATDTD